ncbi:MAG: CdaR family transcriptional regulator [Paenisporosarcina sp.]
MLTKQLANQIVEQTMVRLHRNINVMDTNGMILASGEKERVENIHEGALFVAKTQEPLWITEENVGEWPGTRPGINMPVYYQDHLIAIIGITGDPYIIKEVATLLQLTTEMMIHQSLIVSESEWKRKMKEMVFEELISSHSFPPVLFERLNKLRFPLKSPYFTVLVRIPSSSHYHGVVQQLEDYFENEDVLVGHSQLNEFFILTAGMNTEKIHNKLQRLPQFLHKYNPRIGTGKAVDQIEDIHHSYQTAKLSLHYGLPSNEITFFEEVEVLSLLKKSNSTEARQFSERILKGLDDKDILTLKEYLECNQQLAFCAETLKIHRHTLSYRLKKINEASGYNPNVFQDALLLQLALWLKSD